MAYQNAYNQHIADQLAVANHNYAKTYAYSQVTNSGGHFKLGNASKADGKDGMYNNDLRLPAEYYTGIGGSAFAEGTYRDTGFDHVEGAGASGGVAHYQKAKRGGTKLGLLDGEKIGINGRGKGKKLVDKEGTLLAKSDATLSNGVPPTAQLHSSSMSGQGRSGGKKKKDKEMPISQDAVHIDFEAPKKGCGTKELKEDVSKFDFNRLKDWIGLAKPKEVAEFKRVAKLRGKGFDEFKKDVGSFDFNRVKDWIGLGKYGKPAKLLGAGFWDSIANFFTKTIPSVATQAVDGVKIAARDIARGTKKAVDSVIGKGKITKAERDALVSVAKKHGGKRSEGEFKSAVMPKEKEEKGAGMSGGDGRKKRAEVVRAYMKKHGVKMIEASKKVKELGLYKK